MAEIPIDLAAQLAQQLTALQQKPAGAWGVQTTPLTATGLAVPLKLQTPQGDIRVYLQLPAEAAGSPDAIMQALQSLASQGYPLDTWQPKNSGWGDSGNSGGWNRGGGGGYNRSGGWRR